MGQSASATDDSGGALDLASFSLSAMDVWPSFTPELERDIQHIQHIHAKAKQTPSPQSRKRASSRPLRIATSNLASMHCSATPNFSVVTEKLGKHRKSPPRLNESESARVRSVTSASPSPLPTAGLILRQRGGPQPNQLKQSRAERATATKGFDFPVGMLSSLLDQAVPSDLFARSPSTETETEAKIRGNLPIALASFAHSNLSTSNARSKSILRPVEITNSVPFHSLTKPTVEVDLRETEPAPQHSTPVKRAVIRKAGARRNKLNVTVCADTRSSRAQCNASAAFDDLKGFSPLLTPDATQDLSPIPFHSPLRTVAATTSSQSLPQSTLTGEECRQNEEIPSVSTTQPATTPSLTVSLPVDDAEIPCAPPLIPDAPPCAFVCTDAPPPPPLLDSGIPGAPPSAPPMMNAPPLAPTVIQSTSNNVAKLKKLHWQEIDGFEASDTIFAESSTLAHPKLDLGDIASKFAISHPTLKAPAARVTATAKKAHSTLIDLKRITNINIAMARFGMKHEQLVRAIIECAPTLVNNEDRLSMLLTMIPRDDEIKLLKNYTGNVDELNPVEKLFFSLTTVSELKRRIETLLFVHNFQLHYQSLIDSLTVIESSCIEIRTSQSLRVVLNVILMVGNTLNGKQVKGFKLHCLRQLTTLKTNDSNFPTLLHYIVNVVRTHYDISIQQLSAEMKNVGRVTRLDSSQLRLEIDAVKHKFDGCRSLVNKLATENASSNAPFTGYVSKFTSESQSLLTELLARFQRVLTVTSALCKFFGESDTAWEFFFGEIHSFTQQFEAIHAQIDEREKRRSRDAMMTRKPTSNEENSALPVNRSHANSVSEASKTGPSDTARASVRAPFAQPLDTRRPFAVAERK